MNETDVLILDVTRMKEDKVCIAGLYHEPEKGYREIRPVPPFGNIHIDFLSLKSGETVEPFTVLKMKLKKQAGSPPHTEDVVFEDRYVGSVKFVKKSAPDKCRKILEGISQASLAEIFGEKLVANRYVYEADGGASLGCLAVDQVRGPYVNLRDYEDEKQKLDIRIGLMLENKVEYYPIVELRLYNRVKAEIAAGKQPDDIGKDLQRQIARYSPVYLRVGLTRPWRKISDDDTDPRKKCYVQVLGIHTFPDYLEK